MIKFGHFEIDRGNRLPPQSPRGARYATRRAIPPLHTGLVGREEAVARVCAMLDESRVLTLTGEGGIGKTTLAIAVAHRIAIDQPDGVAFVELAALADLPGLLAAIARSCAMPIEDQCPSVGMIGEWLAGTTHTLILDNAEHMICTVAQTVEALSACSPALRVLVTSREPLRIAWETVLRVDPLDVPACDASEQEVLTQSSVRLFLARAQALRGYGDFDRQDVMLAGAICRRLDGIPLAIELAAACVISFGVEGVYRRLDDRLSILTAGYRTALPRHKTLRATFDWSFALLAPTAQSLFRRLAMFAGVFTLEALCAVVCDAHMTIGAAIDGIGELVSKSMVNVEFDGPVAKYRLSESTRAYALEQLQAQHEMSEIASRMARYLTSRFDTGAAFSCSARIDETADLRQSLDDARSAADWAFSADGDLPLAVELTSTMVGVLWDCCLIEECGRRAARAVMALDELPGQSVDVLTEMRVRAALAGALPNLGGPIERSARLWRDVRDLAHRSGNDEFHARAFWGMWNAALYGGNVNEAFDVAIRFQAFARERGHSWQMTLATHLAAVAQHWRGEHAVARARIESTIRHLTAHPDEAKQISRLAVDPLAICYGALARVVWLQGDPERALAYVDKMVNLINPETMEPWLTHVLGVVAVPLTLLSGDMRRANHYLGIMRSQAALHDFTTWREYSECLVGYRDVLAGRPEEGLATLEVSLDALISRGFRRMITPFIVACAEALICAGRLDDASVRLREALDFCEQHGEMFFIPEIWRALGLVAQAQAALAPRTGGDQEMILARAKGCFLEAIALAQAHGARVWELRATSAMESLKAAPFNIGLTDE